MRTIKQILILALVALLAGNIATAIYKGSSDRNDGPKIYCEEDLEISASAKESELYAGVTASDPQDGDLTHRIIIGGISKLISTNTAKVTYLVFDSDDNMATFVRRIHYTDYRKPTFSVDPKKPLVYVGSEEISVLDRVGAQDVIDGDISARVRVSTLAETIDPEVFDISVQVTNSMGDTAWLKLPVQMFPHDSGRPVVELDQYLVYWERNVEFDPMQFFGKVTLSDGSKGKRKDVKVDDAVDVSELGTYRVIYSYDDEGVVGKAILTVVVV